MVARVCLVSGGTGGHLMPALALARALRQRGHEPMLVTEGREVERKLLDQQSGAMEQVGLSEEKPSLLGMPLWLLRTTLRARAMLRERGIDCVVSTGGRNSLPVGLAARSLRRPLFLLEQNAVSGRTNRMLLPFSRRMYLGLPQREPGSERTVLTGTPLRQEVFGADRSAARRSLGMREDLPVVVVTGGSQGANSINTHVPAALAATGIPMQVIHLSGLGADAAVQARYAAAAAPGLRVTVRPVAVEMPMLLAASDLVVSRGGGTTVAELMAVGRAAVIVPYPHHRDRQQFHNADVLVRAGAAQVVEERDLGVDVLQRLFSDLLRDPARLVRMGEAARAQCPGDPCKAILEDMARQGGLG